MTGLFERQISNPVNSEPEYRSRLDMVFDIITKVIIVSLELYGLSYLFMVMSEFSTGLAYIRLGKAELGQIYITSVKTVSESVNEIVVGVCLILPVTIGVLRLGGKFVKKRQANSGVVGTEEP